MLGTALSFAVRAGVAANVLLALATLSAGGGAGGGGDAAQGAAAAGAVRAWLLGREWPPTALPTLALLYLMRDARNAGPGALHAAGRSGAGVEGAALSPLGGFGGRGRGGPWGSLELTERGDAGGAAGGGRYGAVPPEVPPGD